MRRKMATGTENTGSKRAQWRQALSGPHMLAFLPAIALAGFWIGGEATLFVLSIGLPLVFLYGGAFDRQRGAPLPARTRQTDLMDIHGFGDLADQVLDAARRSGEPTACILIELESGGPVAGLYGEMAVQYMQDQLLRRLRSGLRSNDDAVRVGDARFGVLLEPDRRTSLESALQVAGRLQSLLEEPVAFERRTLYPSVSIGFALSSRIDPKTDGPAFVKAARIALEEAVAAGPSALRAYSAKMKAQENRRYDLIQQVPRALDNGQILPWFQPQVCTDTGRVSGLEALARWDHPKLGVLPPAEFLPSLEASGHMHELAGVMIRRSLAALKSFDAAGAGVPHVAVNLSMAELRDPKLVEKIRWELDASELGPERLRLEVLESVIADGPDGIICRNLSGIVTMGCKLDLDDFGVGQTSLGALRAFAIDRLKIDRSFISRIDRDADQQRLVAAIIGMADQLDLVTVAEGVESSGEHVILAQLGCKHVQGFGIARPMPAAEVPAWIAAHGAALQKAPKFGTGG